MFLDINRIVRHSDWEAQNQITKYMSSLEGRIEDWNESDYKKEVDRRFFIEEHSEEGYQWGASLLISRDQCPHRGLGCFVNVTSEEPASKT